MAHELAARSGAAVTITDDVDTGLQGVDFIHTDVWVSMGEPKDVWDQRVKLLRDYQINAAALERTGNSKVKFMHCLPAFHDRNTVVGKEMMEHTNMPDGLEVTDDVFESAASIVFDQAENRLHTIKAVLVATLGDRLLASPPTRCAITDGCPTRWPSECVRRGRRSSRACFHPRSSATLRSTTTTMATAVAGSLTRVVSANAMRTTAALVIAAMSSEARVPVSWRTRRWPAVMSANTSNAIGAADRRDGAEVEADRENDRDRRGQEQSGRRAASVSAPERRWELTGRRHLLAEAGRPGTARRSLRLRSRRAR